MIRALRLWLLRQREDWIHGQLEVVEDQIHNAPIRRRLLHDQLRRVRVQLAQLHSPAELLAQALARRSVETAAGREQSPVAIASRRH